MGLNSAAAVEDSIIIPCEFCGVQLEEEVLFHHQVSVPGGALWSPCGSSGSMVDVLQPQPVLRACASALETVFAQRAEGGLPDSRGICF